MMNPFVGLAIVVLVGWPVLRHSSKKNEKQFWAKRATQRNPDAHAWADTSPSKSVWACCVLIAIVGAVIIVKTSGF